MGAKHTKGSPHPSSFLHLSLPLPAQPCTDYTEYITSTMPTSTPGSELQIRMPERETRAWRAG